MTTLPLDNKCHNCRKPASKSLCDTCAEKHEQKRKERDTQKKANGICTKCPDKALPDRTLCRKHMDAHKTRSKNRFNSKRSAGICLRCPNVAQIGYKLCDVCASKSRLVHQELKDEVFNAYGGYKCQCKCGCVESTPKCLTLDHINSDGAVHKRRVGSIGAGAAIYRDLRKNNYPDTIRVLCWNCNCGRALNNGVCPKIIV